MTTEGQGQGPLNDPRLAERRGDLSGLNAALFVILVIVAFAAAAYLLATVLHIGGAGVSPSAHPSAPAVASTSPSASLTSSATPAPLVSPSIAPSPSAAASAALREPMDVVVGGHVLGTVTVNAVQYPKTVGGASAGTGLRWLAARIRYDATADLSYDTGQWIVVDATGKQYAWAGVDFKPALGQGTVGAGQKASGNVTFKVPLHGTLWLVYSGADGERRVQLPAQ